MSTPPFPFDPQDNFARRYCAWRGVARENYVESVLAATLYPHARLLHRLAPERWFAVDRAFVESVGRMRRRRDFHDLMRDFLDDHDGHTWLREVLHLRVSVRRMHALVWATYAHAAAAPDEPGLDLHRA
jgi:hypothetical protein